MLNESEWSTDNWPKVFQREFNLDETDEEAAERVGVSLSSPKNPC